MTVTAFRMLAIEQLHESKLNPRKSFDKDRMAELTASVKAKGVLQPIVVRPNADGFEIVCGARRYRAAKGAQLAEIPSIVRELTDGEVLEVAVIENLQRDDVHPLEEAEGYEALIKLPGYNVDELAGKVGKSKAYIYGRLKLCALGKVGREKLYAGELDASTALLIARIPDANLQEEAIKALAEGREYGDITSYRDAAEFLQNNYTLRLKDAPFDVKVYYRGKDGKELAPTCGACPKRSGNQPELFADIKGADVCTDPTCFKAKRESHAAMLLAKAKAAGKQVISGKEAKKAMPHEGGYLRGFHRPTDACREDSKNRSLREVFGDKLAPLQLLQDPHSGDILEVIADADLAPLVAARFPKSSPAAAERSNDDYARQQKAKDDKARRETEFRVRVLAAISTAHPGTMTPVDAALIAEALWDILGHDTKQRVLAVREGAKVLSQDVWNKSKAFAKTITTLEPRELVRLMVQMSVASEVHVNSYSTSRAERLLATAQRLDVDVAAIRKELDGGAKARKAKRTSKPKAKAKAP